MILVVTVTARGVYQRDMLVSRSVQHLGMPTPNLSGVLEWFPHRLASRCRRMEATDEMRKKKGGELTDWCETGAHHVGKCDRWMCCGMVFFGLWINLPVHHLGFVLVVRKDAAVSWLEDDAKNRKLACRWRGDCLCHVYTHKFKYINIHILQTVFLASCCMIYLPNTRDSKTYHHL